MHYGLSLWDGVTGSTEPFSSLTSWLQNNSSPTCLVNGCCNYYKVYIWIFHGFLSINLHLYIQPHWPYKITEQRVRGWYINSPVVSYLSSDRSFFDIQNRFVLQFFSYKKHLRNRRSVISIAVKNACLCWVIQCIAPSIHALTARVATALLMWGVSFEFSSPRIQLFPAEHVTHNHYFQAWVLQETGDQSEQFPDSCIYETTIIAYISLYIVILCMVLGIIGVLLNEKPYTNWRSLTQKCIFFCSHDKLLTSSKALTSPEAATLQQYSTKISSK